MLSLLERDTGHDEAILRPRLELAEVLRSSQVGTHGAQIHRPDLAGWEHEVWVDCMHLDAPFLRPVGASHWRHIPGSDLAVEILLGHARVLQDEGSGLFSHGFNDLVGKPNRIRWGRGQGWALLGWSTRPTCCLPSRLPGMRSCSDCGRRLTGLARTEVESGEWSTVVDVPTTSIEPSVAAFVALGVGGRFDAGLIEPTYRGPCGPGAGEPPRPDSAQTDALRGVRMQRQWVSMRRTTTAGNGRVSRGARDRPCWR